MKVPRTDVFVCPMATPSDTTAVEAVLERIRPESVVALIGKSEGSGLHNDAGRILADLALRSALARRLEIEPEAVDGRILTIISGGCPGVISPHVTLITQEWVEVDPAPTRKALAVGLASSEVIPPEDIGRMGQVRRVAAATRNALATLPPVERSDVHLVMVKAPTLSAATIREAERRGKTVVTRDLSVGPSGAMCFSNDASALGVALGLGEVPAAALNDGVIRREWSLYSEVAMTSSAAEKEHAEVLILANVRSSLSSLRVGHDVLRDLVDEDGIRRALASAGVEFDCPSSQSDAARVVQLFLKMAVPGSNELRGNRITLQDDRDAPQLAKAIGGALAASALGRTTVFVSGGESNSHQGPPDGNPVAAVVRTATAH